MNKPVKQFNWWAVVDKNGKIHDIVNTRAEARNFKVEVGDRVLKIQSLVLVGKEPYK